MIDWLYLVQLAISTVVGFLALGLGFARRKPNTFLIGALVLVEAGLIVQLVTSIVLVISGQQAETDTVEFFAYLLVAMMIPVAAVFWALVERTRWSTVILGVAGLTVAVMLVRMNQIWTGIY